MISLNFKNFFENKPDYLQSGLGVELGMDWSDIVKVLEKEQWITPNLPLGNSFYKLGKWEIIPGTLSPYGADIRVKKGMERAFLKGNRLDKTDGDKETYHLNRKQLINFLTTGWTPQSNSSSGGELI